MAEFSYNNSKHSATTLSPFYANYGFHPRMSLLPSSPDSPTPAADSYVLRLREAQVTLQRELLKARKAMSSPRIGVGDRLQILFRERKCGSFADMFTLPVLPPNWTCADSVLSSSSKRSDFLLSVWSCHRP